LIRTFFVGKSIKKEKDTVKEKKRAKKNYFKLLENSSSPPINLTYYFSKKLAPKILDYQWKCGKKGGTTQVLSVRCPRSFFSQSSLLPFGQLRVYHIVQFFGTTSKFDEECVSP
jgi:hypothetical protein